MAERRNPYRPMTIIYPRECWDRLTRCHIRAQLQRPSDPVYPKRKVLVKCGPRGRGKEADRIKLRARLHVVAAPIVWAWPGFGGAIRLTVDWPKCANELYPLRSNDRTLITADEARDWWSAVAVTHQTRIKREYSDTLQLGLQADALDQFAAWCGQTAEEFLTRVRELEPEDNEYDEPYWAQLVMWAEPGNTAAPALEGRFINRDQPEGAS